jgi:ribonuclease Z
MARIVVLGSANAIPTENHANSHLAIVGRRETVLVDCPAGVLRRIQGADLNLDSLSHLIITHFHPDHAAGLAPLLMTLWLLGRTKPLSIHGLSHSIDRARSMMSLFGWTEWPEMYRVDFNTIPGSENAVVLQTADLEIRASPTRHMVPSIALRVQTRSDGKLAVYSSDTEPCDEVVRLAQGADVLIHEATGEGPGHSSASAAGQVAERAGVGRLFLIHYSSGGRSADAMLSDAASSFSGPVELARDLMSIAL